MLKRLSDLWKYYQDESRKGKAMLQCEVMLYGLHTELEKTKDKVRRKELIKEIISVVEQVHHIEPDDKDFKAQLAKMCTQLANIQLYMNEPGESEVYLRKVMALFPSHEVIKIMLALALLYQGKWPEAKAIYEKYKGHAYDEERGWTQVFLQDLDDLEAAGITHPDVAKARAFLKE